MMNLRTMILWIVPSLCLAYHPSAGEILASMQRELRRPEPVVIQIHRETPSGLVQGEHSIRVPANSREDAAVYPDFLFPFSCLTLPEDKLLPELKPFSDGTPSVKLARFDGCVCYLLEGQGGKIWLRKEDFVPLKIESLSHSGVRTTYIYMDFVDISEEAVYPSRTEVYQNGSLISVEHLSPVRADSAVP